MLTEVPEDVYAPGRGLDWIKNLYLGADSEAREKPQLAYPGGRKGQKSCNALGALPGTLFDALAHLERLDLAHNGLRKCPKATAGLTTLISLSLTGTGLGAEGARHLAGLTALLALVAFFPIIYSNTTANRDQNI